MLKDMDTLGEAERIYPQERCDGRVCTEYAHALIRSKDILVFSLCWLHHKEPNVILLGFIENLIDSVTFSRSSTARDKRVRGERLLRKHNGGIFPMVHVVNLADSQQRLVFRVIVGYDIPSKLCALDDREPRNGLLREVERVR